MKKIFKPAKAICPFCESEIDYAFDYHETQKECPNCKRFFRITLRKVDLLEEGIIGYLKKLDTFSIFDYTIEEIPEITLPETAKTVISKL